MSTQVLILFLLCSTIFSRETNVLFQVFRHGARAPYLFSNIERKEDVLKLNWKIEKESLSPVGIRQQFILGRLLRNKYKPFLDSISEYEVYSGNEERTYLSLSAHMQGVLNSEVPKLTETQLNRFSLPFSSTATDAEAKRLGDKAYPTGFTPFDFTQKRKTDNLINRDRNCAYLKTKISELQESTGLNHFGTKIEPKIKDLEEKTNIVASDLTQYYRIWNIADTFLADYFQGFPLDNDLVMEDTFEFSNQIHKESMFNVEFGLESRDAVSASPIINLLLSQAQEEAKLTILSGNDITLTAICSFLGRYFKFTYFDPEFASSILFEVFTEEKQRKIQIFYDQNSVGVLPLEQFVEVVEPHLMSDEMLESFCGSVEGEEFPTWILFLGLGIILLIIVGTALFLKIRSRRVSLRESLVD